MFVWPLSEAGLVKLQSSNDIKKLKLKYIIWSLVKLLWCGEVLFNNYQRKIIK